jgi:hypothetical protein
MYSYVCQPYCIFVEDVIGDYVTWYESNDTGLSDTQDCIGISVANVHLLVLIFCY